MVAAALPLPGVWRPEVTLRGLARQVGFALVGTRRTLLSGAHAPTGPATGPVKARAYFAGTNHVTDGNKTDGLTFATDTTAMVSKGVLTAARYSMGAAASLTIGYWTGGTTPSTTTDNTTTHGLTFATDTTAMVTKGSLLTARDGTHGAQSSTVAYFLGGETNPSTNVAVTSSEGLAFATDTTTMVTKGSLSSAKGLGAGYESGTTGYQAGGYTGSAATAQTDGLTFATDTTTMVTKGALVTARFSTGGYASSSLGYTFGGSVSNTQTDGLTFATDTTAQVTKGPLTTAAGSNPGGGASSTWGYAAGGGMGTACSGLQFSSDTTSQVTKGAAVISRSQGTIGLEG